MLIEDALAAGIGRRSLRSLHECLGKTAKVDRVEVAWPDKAGTVDVIVGPPADGLLVVEEGRHPRAGGR